MSALNPHRCQSRPNAPPHDTRASLNASNKVAGIAALTAARYRDALEIPLEANRMNKGQGIDTGTQPRGISADAHHGSEQHPQPSVSSVAAPDADTAQETTTCGPAIPHSHDNQAAVTGGRVRYIQHTPIAAKGKPTYPSSASPINTSEYFVAHQLTPNRM